LLKLLFVERTEQKVTWFCNFLSIRLQTFARIYSFGTFSFFHITLNLLFTSLFFIFNSSNHILMLILLLLLLKSFYSAYLVCKKSRKFFLISFNIVGHLALDPIFLRKFLFSIHFLYFRLILNVWYMTLSFIGGQVTKINHAFGSRYIEVYFTPLS